MDFKKAVKKILRDVGSGRLRPEEAYKQLKTLPYHNLKFARIDYHRVIRKGVGEVVYCEGKTHRQVRSIAEDILKRRLPLFLTRSSPELYAYLRKYFPLLKYNKKARIIYYGASKRKKEGRVLIMTAGTGDIPVGEEARVTLEFLGNRVDTVYDVGVAGIHRLFDNIDLIRRSKVIIVIAGMEGALASVVAGLTDRPVIAVPTSVGYGSNFKGLAALLTMMNCCSPGVAVVNIDNGFGAGYFASLINRGRVIRERHLSGAGKVLV